MRDAPAHGSRRGSGSGWAPDSAGLAHGPLEHVKPPASLTNRSLLQRMTRPCPVATLPSAYGRRLPREATLLLPARPPWTEGLLPEVTGWQQGLCTALPASSRTAQRPAQTPPGDSSLGPWALADRGPAPRPSPVRPCKRLTVGRRWKTRPPTMDPTSVCRQRDRMKGAFPSRPAGGLPARVGFGVLPPWRKPQNGWLQQPRNWDIIVTRTPLLYRRSL